MRNKKILAFALVLSSVGILVFFRHAIFQFGVEAFLNAKIANKDWRFDYERIELKKDRISFSHIKLETKEPFANGHIDCVDIIMKRGRGLSFEVGIRLDSPFISLKSGEAEGFSFLDYATSSFAHRKIDIEGAEIEWIGEKEPAKVYFSLMSDENRRTLGTFYLSDKPPNKESANVVFKLYEWPEEWIVELELQEASLPWMNRFFKQGEYQWDVIQGTANGHLWLGFLKNGEISQVNANLRVAEVEGFHEKNGLQANIETLSLDMLYPNGKRRENFWQNVFVKLDVKGGRIGCKDEKTEVDFALCDLNGHLNFQSFKDSEILLQGYLDHKDQMTPIVLSATPSSGDVDTLDVDLRLAESLSSTHLNLAIAREGEDLCVVRGRLKEMGVDQIAMMQHVAGFFSPQIKDFQLKKGTVTSELSLRLVKGVVEKVLLDDILADDLEVYWISRDILATCAHLSGRAKLDFQNLFSFEMPNWEVNLQKGELFCGGKEPVRVQDISMQLFMCRKVFEPSWVRASYEGVDVLLDIVGYYSEADVKMHLSTTGDKLLQLFCNDVKDVKQFSQHRIHTDIDFHRQLGYWEVLGKAYLNVIEDWEDSLKFGCFVSDRIFEENHWKKRIQEALSKGWIETDFISCEFVKFINCSIQADWLLEGVGSFKGSFSGEELNVLVKFSDANFFSPFLDLRLNARETEDLEVYSEGEFSWNFIKNEWRGTIPLHQAKIHEKSTGLCFQNTQGDLCFQENSIVLEQFTTESEGVVFGGNLILQMPKVSLEIHSLTGSVSEVEKILHHIPNWSLLKMPFEGLIRAKEEGIFIAYDPDKELEASLHLELVHGVYEITKALTVHELSFDVSLEGKKIVLSNVFGKIPSIFHEGGYCLNGKEIELYFGEEPHLQFDVRLENQVMDLMRFVGSYNLNTGVVELDKKMTHLFTAHPESIALTLFKECELALRIPLQEVVNYGKILIDIGVLGKESSEFFHKIYNWTGDVETRVLFKAETLEIDLLHEQFHCNVVKKCDRFEIKALRVGAFEVAAELVFNERGCAISHLKGFGEHSSVVFGEGFFDREKKRIELPIQEAFVDFDECIPKLGKGKIHASGVIGMDFSQGILQAFIEGRINIRGERDLLYIKSLSDLYVMYTWDRGLVIQEGLFELSSETVKTLFEIPFCSYSFEDQLFQGYRIRTHYGEPEIQYLSEKIGVWLDIPQNVLGRTEVVLDVEVAKDRLQISGVLNEGEYVWKGRQLFLKETKWFYDKNHLNVDVTLPFWGSEFSIQTKTYLDDEGRTIIEGVEKGGKETALYVECRLLDPEGLSIQKLQGNLFGLEFQFLKANKMEEWTFLGDIKIDVDRLKLVVGDDIKQFLEDLKFHRGYELKGELTIKREDLGASFFEGYLKGRDFDFLGYVFKTLLASVRIDQKGIYLKDLSISDEGVTAAIDELKIDLSLRGGLSLHIPEIRVDELRPSLLKKKYEHQRLKPFCVKTMVFQDVTGNLADVRSFTGKGHLKFVNTFKEGHNLLDIPIEIISRLGLDIGLLVPIQGEMDYVIKNGKLIFTKLKNSFSESKRSYFYLWNKTESYIDFYGNMHIDIRMKQYVLFKITELFILSLQGSLEKPKCCLR